LQAAIASSIYPELQSVSQNSNISGLLLSFISENNLLAIFVVFGLFTPWNCTFSLKYR